jgi:hypothetical protein
MSVIENDGGNHGTRTILTKMSARSDRAYNTFTILLAFRTSALRTKSLISGIE